MTTYKGVIHLTAVLLLLVFFLWTTKSSGPSYSASFLSVKIDENTPFTAEEIEDFVKPALVRAQNEIKGEATIPSFKIDPKTFGVKLSPKDIINVDVDEILEADGFVINPAGHILITSFVLSTDRVKLKILQKLVDLYVDKELLRTKEGNQAQFQRGISSQLTQITSELKAKSQFALSSDLTVKFITNQETEMKVAGSVINSSDTQTGDDQGLVILRTIKTDLPSLKLDDTQLSTGETVFAFEQSGLRQLKIDSLENQTQPGAEFYNLTPAILNILDGAPLIDQRTKVRGVASIVNGVLKGVSTRVIKGFLNRVDVKNEEGTYSEHFRRGLMLLENRRCKSAIQELTLAKAATSNDQAQQNVIEKYIRRCSAFIAAGDSIDTKIDEALYVLSRPGMIKLIALVGAAVLFLVITISAVFGFRKWKQKRAVIKIAQEPQEKPLQREKELIKKKPAYLSYLTESKIIPQEEETQVNPDLLQYVKDCRKLGYDDESIHAALKKAGWEEGEVKRALLLEK